MAVITKAKIEDLRTSVLHAGLDDIPLTGIGRHHDNVILAHVSKFAKPRSDGACLACGSVGTFVWGLVHGSGHCHNCGWPARLYHFVNTENEKEIRIVVLLQAHPDNVSTRPK